MRICFRSTLCRGLERCYYDHRKIREVPRDFEGSGVERRSESVQFCKLGWRCRRSHGWSHILGTEGIPQSYVVLRAAVHKYEPSDLTGVFKGENSHI